MIGPHPIEGYAIVSADGMIADGNGAMPDCIRNDADQHFLQAAMDRAAAIVHGRRSHEGGPRAAKRKRLVVTRQVRAIAADPSQPNALLWNPAGAESRAGHRRARCRRGADCRHRRHRGVQTCSCRSMMCFISAARRARRFPGGQPLFSAVSPTTKVDDVLMRHGLRPSPSRDIDAAAGITLTNFERIPQ